MGIFSDYVRRYVDRGLSVIPCDNKQKKPIIAGWQQFCERLPTEDEIVKWEKEFNQTDKIGLCLGRASGVVAFDFDYDYDEKRMTISHDEFLKDYKYVEKTINALLPPTPAVKRGKKGWTKFYKWNDSLEGRSNVVADRNGVRLFDFLSWHKQTIIPPSIHSIGDDGKAIYYQWMNDSLEDCLDILPEINLVVIDDIKHSLEIKSDKSEKTERHGRLFAWIMRQSAFEKDVMKIAQGLVLFDLKEHPDKPYLSDQKYNNNRIDPVLYAKAWVERVHRWMGAKSDDKKVPEAVQAAVNSRDTYFQFFEQHLGEHRVDILSHKFLRKIKYQNRNGTSVERWVPVLNTEDEIKSEALERGLKPSVINYHLASYASKIKPDFLFDTPKWDGVDRLAKICSHVQLGNGLTSEMFTDIIKDIAAGIFRRALGTREQNLCSIIRGKQKIGKNEFITQVFGKPLEPYYAEINVTADQQKNYDAVDGKLVCVIGEFDQTLKVQISFLKELITNSTYSARRAYAKEAGTYQLYQTIFCASNFDNVLRDSSGNRRFVVFDFEKIDWAYSKHVDNDQLRAQFFHLYEQDYRMGKESATWIAMVNEEERPVSITDLALIDYIERIKRLGAGHQYDQFFGNEMVKDIIVEVSKIHGMKENILRAAINKAKLTEPYQKMRYYNLFLKKFDAVCEDVFRRVDPLIIGPKEDDPLINEVH